MTPDRWRQVTEIFHTALARDEAMREAYLAETCRDDASLRADVERLLAAHGDADAGSFGAAPVFVQGESPRIESGTTLGQYRIEALIGAGGMGEVYRARDTRLGRYVAVKVLPREAADAERQQRFAREAQIIASLNHPNIVTLHSVEQSGDHHFLTMELVDGRTLRELIPPGGFPLDRLLDIAVPLADAVGAAHARGVIHRDLKPGNVMVTADGRVKVLDFGLAKLKPAPALSGDLTTAAARDHRRQPRAGHGRLHVAGTGRGARGRSPLRHLLARGAAVRAGRRTAALRRRIDRLLLSSILKDTPSSVTERRPDLPPDLGRLVRRCLAKDPTRRYQSALDLRNELEEIRQDMQSGALKASSTKAVAAEHGH